MIFSKKTYFFLILASLLSFALMLSPSLGLAKEKNHSEDYKFYRRHGHDSRKWNKEVEAGFLAFDQGDCAGTVSSLKAAIGKRCQDPLVYYKMALCTEMSGSLYTALQYYQLAQESLKLLNRPHRYQVEIFENYGRALYQSGDLDNALTYLQQADAVGQPSFGLYVLMGSLLEKKKDLNNALTYYQKALKQPSSEEDAEVKANLHLKLALYHQQNKNFSEAISHAQEVIKILPNNSQAQAIKNESQQKLKQEAFFKKLEQFGKGMGGETEGNKEKATPLPAAEKLPPLN